MYIYQPDAQLLTKHNTQRVQTRSKMTRQLHVLYKASLQRPSRAYSLDLLSVYHCEIRNSMTVIRTGSPSVSASAAGNKSSRYKVSVHLGHCSALPEGNSSTELILVALSAEPEVCVRAERA